MRWLHYDFELASRLPPVRVYKRESDGMYVCTCQWDKVDGAGPCGHIVQVWHALHTVRTETGVNTWEQFMKYFKPCWTVDFGVRTSAACPPTVAVDAAAPTEQIKNPPKADRKTNRKSDKKSAPKEPRKRASTVPEPRRTAGIDMAANAARQGRQWASVRGHFSKAVDTVAAATGSVVGAAMGFVGVGSAAAAPEQHGPGETMP